MNTEQSLHINSNMIKKSNDNLKISGLLKLSILIFLRIVQRQIWVGIFRNRTHYYGHVRLFCLLCHSGGSSTHHLQFQAMLFSIEPFRLAL